MTTAAVDIKMARYEGTILSKKIGRAYSAKAFDSSKVESKKWWLFRIYKIELAIFFLSSSSEFAQISISALLIDIYPIVSPEQTPAKQDNPNENSA